jgi:hypothetical protein|tara:strand:+ start:19787 stop:19978 length:192 start_codon:yes stop_codon:yes gene_type:complete
MKNYIFLILATILLVFNISKLNLENIYSNDSKIALIGVLACSCAIILLTILHLSKKIKDKTKS